MKKSEMDVTILVRGNSYDDLFNEYKILDVPLVFMPLGYLKPGRWYKYYRFFKKNDFNTICDFNGNFAGIPMWLAKMAKIKNRIAFYRQGKDHFHASMVKRAYNHLMNRLVYKYSTKVLSNSKAGMDFFFSYRNPDDPRFKVIYNGVDITPFKIKVNKGELRQRIGIPENAFIIGHTGRFDKFKNHPTILKVASELIRSDKNIYLVLCGRGTEKLSDEVNALNITDNVRLLGYRPDVPALLQVFDLFYFPSITEGQPNALIEAMMAGLPVIASNIEPIKEIFPDLSMLFDPYDINNVVSHIKHIIINNKEGYKAEFSRYAEIKFSAEARFNDFFYELI